MTKCGTIQTRTLTAWFLTKKSRNIIWQGAINSDKLSDSFVANGQQINLNILNIFVPLSSSGQILSIYSGYINTCILEFKLLKRKTALVPPVSAWYMRWRNIMIMPEDTLLLWLTVFGSDIHLTYIFIKKI